MGKSAQFPLHVWLPDAMEGPTPVSRADPRRDDGQRRRLPGRPGQPDLRHARRRRWSSSPAIGIFTAILAASIAMTQTDIKRVLAYSTLSQLGYMFAALGVGAFTAAIFHLMTHGFFKGLLFLGSGSVIHAVHEEQDMRRMGGLAKKIPITYWTMLIGSLAIAGIPPLAGFFSRTRSSARRSRLGFRWVWAIGIVVAVMTAFYMFRLMGLTFWGACRVDPRRSGPQIHESPPVMTMPLILLAIPSVLLGVVLSLGARPVGRAACSPAGSSRSSRRAEELLGREEAAVQLVGIDGVLILASVAVAVVGIVAAWRLFGVEIGASAAGEPERVRELDRPGPVPVPRVAQQVVVRRAQQPAVHRDRRAGGRGPLVVRPARSSTAP